MIDEHSSYLTKATGISYSYVETNSRGDIALGSIKGKSRTFVAEK